MGTKRELAVSNTGPPVHLAEIKALPALDIWRVLIPEAVQKEIRKYNGEASFEVRQLSPEAKDAASLLIVRYQIDLGEAEAIALAKQEDIKLFFTDDLDARSVANKLGLEPHGSVGILLRAFREGKLVKDAALAALTDLHEKSSLFITRELVEQAKAAVRAFEK